MHKHVSWLMKEMAHIKKIDKNTIFISIAVIGVLITGALIYLDQNKGFSMTNIIGMSEKQVATKVIDYINNNQLSTTPASMVSVTTESGLVKIKIKIGTSEFDSYATKNGKLLFPQVFDMSAVKDGAVAGQNADTTPAATPDTVTKTDKPMLEAYVVSRCPYGLQMQRAMADAVQNMPALAPYMKVLYMGSVSGNTITAMHGDEEAQENLRQICIREEQPAKYWGYVACQMKAGGQEVACEKSTGVDSAKLSSCISTPSKGVAYAKVDFALNTKYGVTGSPTLVLNGATIDESGFGGRSSDGVKSMICAGFNTKASFCSTTLNKASAASSFSPTYSTSASGAAANSGANAAACAPAQ